MKKHWLPALLILIVCTVLGVFLSRHLEWHEEQVRGKVSAEALANPWHAGRLLLNASGMEAEAPRTTSALEHLPRRQTLMLSGLDRLAEPDLREHLLSWVSAGGHLVLPITGKNEGNALLERLGVRITGGVSAFDRSRTKDAAAIPALRVEQGQYELDTPWMTAFELSPAENVRTVWTAGVLSRLSPDPDDADEDADDDTPGDEEATPDSNATRSPEQTTVFARLHYGDGWITLGSFDAFDNDHIAQRDHAALFMRLMTLPDAQRSVTMLKLTPYDGLWRWLLDHAPEALFIAALMLLAWLRREMPRFGPLLPEPPPARPGLREHLAASGRFLLRERCFEALLAPLRDSVIRQLDALAHRHPAFDSRERMGEHVSGIAADEIRRALGTAPDSPHEFLRRARVLATLRQRCRLLASPTGVQP